MSGTTARAESGGRRIAAAAIAAIAAYTGLTAACLALAPWVRASGWVGDAPLHALHEAVAVTLALAVAAIALVRYHSRKSNSFLLLGAAFLGTALLDTYHALATSDFFAARFRGSELLSTSPWSWIASRLFLGLFLFLHAQALRPGRRRKASFDERTVFLLVGGVTLACFAFFTFVPLPSAYLPDSAVHRPEDLLPALFFLLALVSHLRRGEWRDGGFEHYLVMALLLGFLGQVAFMPFASRPFDAPSEAGHLAKNLSYLLVLMGLLNNMYALFRRADASAADLARINAALQAEIDERERVEQERDNFFDITEEMLCIAGFDGWFKQLNPAWEKTLGFTLEELKSRPYQELVHPDDRPSTRGEEQRLRLGGGAIDFENRFLTRDGTYRWLCWRAVTSPERGLIYAVARDVEEQKRIERMKNDFVSVVSHELRTPLTSIRGALGLLAGGVAGELPEKARPLIDIAAKNSERLGRLINDILDIEKIESGKINFRLGPLELAPLLEHAVESNRTYAAGYEVELRLAPGLPDARVWADSDRLEQVMTNLLSNACKFSPRGGVVEIAAERLGEGRIRVAVTDHGRGVSPEFRSQIFGKFAQADTSSTRQKGGTGLGLSISKAIVERHGGRIGFDSEPGVATTFFFELPEWGGASLGASGGGGRPRILICEDDRDVARLLGLMLERDGFDTDVALDAATAKRLLAERRYAAMTLDLMLPDQDGISLLRELRGAEATSRMPIVVVSVRAQEGRVELDGGALGVVDWLIKPIDEGQLMLAVRRAVRGSLGAEPRILHVEDDPDLQRVVAAIVSPNAVVEAASTLAEARRRLAEESFDLVILDLALPDGSGLELLPFLGHLAPPTPVLVFSAHEVDGAVADRVASVLIKSQTSNRELLETIRSVLDRRTPTPF
jgi:PAS domain S-box-containing protein